MAEKLVKISEELAVPEWMEVNPTDYRQILDSGLRLFHQKYSAGKSGDSLAMLVAVNDGQDLPILVLLRPAGRKPTRAWQHRLWQVQLSRQGDTDDVRSYIVEQQWLEPENLQWLEKHWDSWDDIAVERRPFILGLATAVWLPEQLEFWLNSSELMPEKPGTMYRYNWTIRGRQTMGTATDKFANDFVCEAWPTSVLSQRTTGCKGAYRWSRDERAWVPMPELRPVQR